VHGTKLAVFVAGSQGVRQLIGNWLNLFGLKIYRTYGNVFIFVVEKKGIQFSFMPIRG